MLFFAIGFFLTTTSFTSARLPPILPHFGLRYDTINFGQPMQNENNEMDWRDATFVYDTFFEYNRLWAKQRWMGIHSEQNPSDAWIIQEILFDSRPDLIVETGTHNGGGALFYATMMKMMELYYPRDDDDDDGGSGSEASTNNTPPKILTVDMNDINFIGHSGIEGGCFNHSCRNVTSHKLYQEMVIPFRGSSTDKSIVNLIKKYIKDNGYKKVMVVLDSAHNYPHVWDELNMYWDIVSVGQYLIVQDTHLDRLRTTSAHVRTNRGEQWKGPWVAVQAFLDNHPASENFQQDKRREYLLYSQHHDGYLLRVK